jgi:hypothetical protein
MRFLLSLCCILGMIGCSSTSFIVVSPDYSGASCRDRSLTLLPLPHDLISLYDTVDVRKDFPEDHRACMEIVRDSCYQSMVEELSLHLEGIRPDTASFPVDTIKNLADSGCFLALHYDAGKDSLPLKFYLPSASCIGKSVDIGLVFNQLTFSRDEGRTGIPFPGGALLGGSPPSLNSGIMFLIWDYKKDRPIAYGRTMVKKNFIISMKQSTWKEQFRQILESVFKKTAFGIN